MIDAVYEAHSDLGMVVSHQDDVEQLLAVRVELPQPRVDVHQRLRERTERFLRQGVVSEVTTRGLQHKREHRALKQQ